MTINEFKYSRNYGTGKNYRRLLYPKSRYRSTMSLSSRAAATTGTFTTQPREADSWFAHLAFEVPGENTSNEWLEPVTDEEYNRLGQ